MNLFGLFFHDESQGVNDLHACSASVENLENIKNQHSLENAEMYIIKPVKMKRMVVYTHFTSTDNPFFDDSAKHVNEKPYHITATLEPRNVIPDKSTFTMQLIDNKLHFPKYYIDDVVDAALKKMRENNIKGDKISLIYGACQTSDSTYQNVMISITFGNGKDRYAVVKTGTDGKYTVMYVNNINNIKGRYEDISDFSQVINTQGMFCVCDDDLENYVLMFAINNPEISREQIMKEFRTAYTKNNCSSNPIDLDMFYDEGCMNA
jgi:cystathionine beta-lyase/cystathionine gamma-synthase